MITGRRKLLFPLILTLILAYGASAQSGHASKGDSVDGTVISLTAVREDKRAEPIKAQELFLYENGVEQRIINLVTDPSPARIVLLVDNSLTLPTSVEAMKQAVMEFAYEIFEGDQLFIIAYDEKPEIIQEWSDDAKKIEASLATFRKKGNPYLFDALEASVKEVLTPLMPGTRKTAVVLIGDGLDRGSSAKFDKVLSDLQNQSVTVYSLQIPDRTGGAYRRDQPKAKAVIDQLTDGTGGKAFPFEEASAAAKFICDELKKNRYLLSYAPVNTSTYDARKIFLLGNEGISVRAKSMHPPNVK